MGNRISNICPVFIPVPEETKIFMDGQNLVIDGSKGALGISLPPQFKLGIEMGSDDPRDRTTIEDLCKIHKIPLFAYQVRKSSIKIFLIVTDPFPRGKRRGLPVTKAQYGLWSRYISNMIVGVHNTFEKKLKIIGVGYRARVSGEHLILNIGYSHPRKLLIPIHLKVTVTNSISIIISGILKNEVSNFASKIRSIRPPEPYKGKGIMYKNEIIRRKIGKRAK